MKKLLTGLVGAVALVSTAHAGTVYTYEGPATVQNTGAGTISHLFYEYNSDGFISYNADLTYDDASASRADGGWFVLSGGANPKNSANELAIFYMDFDGGDVYAYRYDGRHAGGLGSASFLDHSLYLTTYEDVLNVSENGNVLNVSFNDLDFSSYLPGTLSADWTGVAFDEKIGIWQHFAVLDAFQVGNDGKLKRFKASLRSWYDANDEMTTVPEPMGLAALGLAGVVGFAAYRRRKTQKSA